MGGPAMPVTGTAVVIEDDEDIGALVRAVLTMSGVEAMVSPTGLSGVAAVRDRMPALVILDFGLPDINGLEVIRRIREFSDVYILMLTGYEDLIEALIAAGANAAIAKPFRVKELREHVDVVLRSSRSAQSP